MIIKIIFLIIVFIMFLIFLMNKILIFILGFQKIQSIALDYIIIKKVKTIIEFQENYLNSSDKESVKKAYSQRLEQVRKEKTENHIEACLDYYPSRFNILKGFFRWLFSAHEKFTISESGYTYIMVLSNFIESNRKYLNYKVVDEKSEV